MSGFSGLTAIRQPADSRTRISLYIFDESPHGISRVFLLKNKELKPLEHFLCTHLETFSHYSPQRDACMDHLSECPKRHGFKLTYSRLSGLALGTFGRNLSPY